MRAHHQHVVWQSGVGVQHQCAGSKPFPGPDAITSSLRVPRSPYRQQFGPKGELWRRDDPRRLHPRPHLHARPSRCLLLMVLTRTLSTLLTAGAEHRSPVALLQLPAPEVLARSYWRF